MAAVLPELPDLYPPRPVQCTCRRQVEREINIHINLVHDNIIGLFGAFEDENNVYLVQE